MLQQKDFPTYFNDTEFNRQLGPWKKVYKLEELYQH